LASGPEPAEQAGLRSATPRLRAWEAGAVLAILALQVLVFSASWTAFFCGDSIYYLSRLVEPARLRFLFTHYDAQGAYRPLTYVVFTWVLYPLSGLRPFGYHPAVSGFAALNSLLFYCLVRRLLRARAALAAFFLFALHGVQFYASYDVTFLPDQLMTFCWFMALLAYGHYALRRSWTAYAASLLWFAAAFLSKETALMLPVTVAVWHWLLIAGQKSGAEAPGSDGLEHREIKGLALLPFFACTGLFLEWTRYVKHGLLYPGGVYGFTLHPADLWPKLKYAGWLVNLPDHPLGAGLAGWVAAALALPAVAWICYRLGRAWGRGKWQLLACGAWMAAALGPLLVVTQVPMEHNLYVPLAGFAIALGIALEKGSAPEVPGSMPGAPGFARSTYGGGSVAVALVTLAALSLTLSTWLQARFNVRESWVGQGSRITEAALASMQRYYPRLPRGSLLYMLPTTVRGNVAWYFDCGGLFRVFYGDPALRMLFADSEHKLPAGFATRPDVFILSFVDNQLFDVTADYEAGYMPTVVSRLLDRFSNAAVSMDRSEAYPDSSHFDTPTGRPAFLHQVEAGGAGRPALVTLAGAHVAFPLFVPVFEGGTPHQLLVSVAPALRVGDGMEARVVLETPGKREVLFSRYVRPGDDWYDASIPLAALQGASGRLVLECSSGSQHDTTGDWLAWARLLVVAGQQDTQRGEANNAVSVEEHRGNKRQLHSPSPNRPRSVSEDESLSPQQLGPAASGA